MRNNQGFYWAEYSVLDGEHTIYSNVSGQFDTELNLFNSLATKVPRGGQMKIVMYSGQIKIGEYLAYDKKEGK